MKQRKHKMLSIFLIAVMILGLMPGLSQVSYASAPGKPYDLELDGGVLRWSEAVGAEVYEVGVYLRSTEYAHGTTTDTCYDFSSVLEEKGSALYKFVVTARNADGSKENSIEAFYLKPGDIEITSVSATIPEPKAGMTPPTAVVSGDSSKYSVRVTELVDVGYSWFHGGTIGMPGPRMGKDEVCKENDTYIVEIAFEAKEGYALHVPATQATLNGKTGMETSWALGRKITFRYAFDVVLKTWTVTWDLNGGTNTGWPETEIWDDGDEITFGYLYHINIPSLVTAPAGKEFDRFEIDGVSYDEDALYTVLHDVTVKFIWKDITYHVDVPNDGNGTASASAVSGTPGTEITLTAKPKNGYRFKEWQVISGGITIKNNKFTLGSEDVAVKAVFEPVPKPVGWQDVNGKKYYYLTDGTAAVGWQTISGKWYYFGTDGVMVTGWQTISGKRYYFGTDGVMVTGLQTISDKQYYFGTDGVMVTGLQTISDKQYYFGIDGSMVTGLQTISDKQYYFGTDGAMVTGLQPISDKLYYFGTDGAMVTGWQKISKKWYYLGTDGVMTTGWKQISGKWYYFGTNGVVKIKWQQISEKWYYFGTDGVMVTGWQQISDKWYYFGANGVVKVKWQKISGKWYYFGTDAVMVTGWQKISNKWYYFGTNGAMTTGWKQISGKWYYFGEDGVVKIKWQQISGQWYYFGTDGVVVIGWQQISGKWYYFGKDAVMVTGWQKISGKWYYFGTNGVMVTGTQTINGKTYTFDSNGVWVS